MTFQQQLGPRILSRSLARSLRLIVAGMLAFSACTSAPPPIRVNAQYAEPERWDKQLEAHTRDVKVYQELNTVLLAKATLKTQALRESYLEEYARRYRLTAAELKTLQEKDLEDATKGLSLIVWTTAPDHRKCSLLPEDGLWKLRLFGSDGKAAEPLEVSWERSAMTLEKAFFPYLNGIGRIFHVRFPQAPEGGRPFLEGSWVALQLTGAVGAAEMRWELAR